ncbi:MAG: alpha/beta hydrolase [Planctomycetes bacterium]|nr:alpha/beta hydrolase [Planctomycetota bacterium]MBI3846176.1 alpha/beta hydrolase [Planctomycetota bacterium]
MVIARKWLAPAITIGVLSCAAKVADEARLPDGRFLGIDGRRIFVKQSGAGPDLFLLHGLGDSHLGWQRVFPALVAVGHRVTAWDALGAGESDKPSRDDYSIEGHATRLVAAMDALGIERATLVGNSLGGSVALMVAESRPERVSALVLIDPAAYREGAMDGRWFWTTPLLADVVLGILPTRSIAEYGLGRNVHSKDALTDDVVDAYARNAAKPGAIRAFLAQERQLVPSDAESWEARHRTIRAPTLILWGREDGLLPLAQGERLARDIPGARLVVLDNVGHAAQLEAPDRVLDLLMPFLAEAATNR